MEKIKKDLIIDLLVEHGLNPVGVYSIANGVEKVIDSEFHMFAGVKIVFDSWTSEFQSDQLYEVKRTKDKFEIRPHNKKQ